MSFGGFWLFIFGEGGVQRSCSVHKFDLRRVPKGFEVQIRPRSGLAAKKKISVLNTPGTIDADYRGEIKVILINFNDKVFTVEKGLRIAQMVVCPVIQAQLEEVSELDNTHRGKGGFGSTGIK